MPKIYNHKDLRNAPDDAVNVDRRSPFGNPFTMFGEHQRNYVCDEFENWVTQSPDFIAKVKKELKGKDLVCWCAPKRCHAETLLRIANE